MGCEPSHVKTALIAINVIFFLCGGIILGTGLAVRFEPSINRYVNAMGISVLTSKLYIASYILCVLGALTFFIGFLGCCGAMKSDKRMMWVYVALVTTTLVAEIGGGVFVFSNKDRYIGELEDFAQKYISEKYTNNASSISDRAWNDAMRKLGCCGVLGPSDFNASAFQRKSRDTVPAVCYTNGPLNTRGCKTALKELLVKYSAVLLGIAIGVALFETAVAAMAIAFICTYNKNVEAN